MLLAKKQGHEPFKGLGVRKNSRPPSAPISGYQRRLAMQLPGYGIGNLQLSTCNLQLFLCAYGSKMRSVYSGERALSALG
jgi:hypothetical protein